MKFTPLILLVDDSEDNLFLLKEILLPLKVSFITCESGIEALQVIDKYEFALAIIDVQMPKMDGYETVEKLRKKEAAKYLPIIFISAIYSTDFYRIRGIQSGAVDFMTKPVVAEIITGKVQVFLDLYLQRKRLEQTNKELAHNIEERLKMESVLKASEEKLRTITNTARDAIIMLTPEGEIIFSNPAAATIFGFSKAELLNMNIEEIFCAEGLPKSEILRNFKTELKESFQNKLIELVAVNKSGEKIPVEISLSYTELNDNQTAIGVIRDISQRKKAELQIRNSLREKERLLSEIHHRVKNNMQMVSTLLELQSSCIAPENAQEAFLSSVDRINSMAMIHEKLYESRNFGEIELDSYINDLAYELITTYQGSKDIEVKFSLEPIMIEIDSAITLGLLLNELITNTLKHAFVNRETGIINISLKKLEIENYLELIIRDNGVGIAIEKIAPSDNSLGMQLIQGFITELKGKLNIYNENGCVFQITFCPEKKSRG